MLTLFFCPGTGHFYVIDLSDLTKYSDNVTAYEKLSFHGKLLWDEDGTLGNRGYATSTGEPFLFQLDLLNGELTRSYDFSNDVVDGTCFGLHGIACVWRQGARLPPIARPVSDRGDRFRAPL